MKIELGKALVDMSSQGDTWDACWADDDNLYISSDDTGGFGAPKWSNLQFHVLRGKSPEELTGETINTMDEYGGPSERGSDGCMWKACGSTCVDGILYCFVSRHEVDAFCHPEKKDEAKLQSARNCSLIMSEDKGRTWHRTAAENYQSPMFSSGRFGSPYFVKYGKDGMAPVHNADRYIYAVANNGFWENGDDMILARVLRTKIARLVADDWQFFTSGDGMQDAAWSEDIHHAQPIIVNPGKCSMTGIQYIEPLERYLMIQWYYPKGSGHLASDETAWIFYEAKTPWGPWNAFHTQAFPVVAYYNPCIASKFISADGKHLTIFTNGDFKTVGKEGADCIYRLTIIPCTLSV